MADTREYVIENAEYGVEYAFDAADVLDVTTRQGGILVVELLDGSTTAFTSSEYTRWYLRTPDGEELPTCPTKPRN